MKEIKDYSHLIGIPYKTKDCFGLAVSFYKDVLGIELKNYYSEIPETKSDSQNLIYSCMGDFKKVSEPQFGDLILMKFYGIESHIGIYVGDEKVLHTFNNIGSHIDSITKFKRMITGYFRV